MFAYLLLSVLSIAILQDGYLSQSDLDVMSKRELVEVVNGLQDENRELWQRLKWRLAEDETGQFTSGDLDPQMLDNVRRAMREKQAAYQAAYVDGLISVLETLKTQSRQAPKAKIKSSLNEPWKWDETEKTFTVKSRAARGELIREIRSNLKDQTQRLNGVSKNQDHAPFDFIIKDRVRVGTIGRLESSVKVLQIIGADSFRGELIEWTLGVSPWGPMMWNTRKVDAIFLGFGLGSVVDGEMVRINSYIRFTGTTTYQTAIGGTNTVYKVEPFDMQPYIDHVISTCAYIP